MKVNFLPEAEFELNEALEWYGRQRFGLDDEFMICIDEAISRIKRSPEMFPLELKNVRKALVKRFPYLIYFEAGNEEIMILAVFHAKRDPKQWKRRV